MDKKNSFLALAALAVIIGMGSFIYRTQFALPKSNPAPFETLGQEAAEETAKLLAGPGRVVVVTELIEVARNPNLEAQVKAFKAGLAKHTGVTLKAAQELKRPPSEDPRVWPSAQAGQLAAFTEGADASVFFTSLPQQFTAADIASLKGAKGKVVIVANQSPVLKPLLQQGIIHLAIVNRFPPKPAPSGKETPRQWFDRVYLVAKSDALGELP